MNDCSFRPRRRDQEVEHPDRAIRRSPRGVAVELKHPRQLGAFPGEVAMRRVTVLVAGAVVLALTLPVFAQDTKVVVGYSGWPGFAPLTLAKEAGIF
jgi:hypothetical protein